MEPASIQGAILYGVVSGVLTSALLVALSRLFSLIILPGYQNLVYRGIRIAGEWEIRTEGLTQIIRLKISQKAYILEGEVAVLSKDATSQKNYEDLRTFALKGGIQDRFVELSLRHSDHSRLGAGTLLLEVIGDGRVMKGAYAFYSVSNNKIISLEVEARRSIVVPEKPLVAKGEILPPIQSHKDSKTESQKKS